jgi:hypothetical protein
MSIRKEIVVISRDFILTFLNKLAYLYKKGVVDEQKYDEKQVKILAHWHNLLCVHPLLWYWYHDKHFEHKGITHFTPCSF